MPSQTELRQQITNQIIEALTSGKLPPWRKPWSAHKNAGLPVNVVSGNRYSGVNPLLLQIAAERHGLQSKYWGTFKQWQSLGGSVKRRPSDVPPGEWGTSIVFYKSITKRNTDPDTGEEEESCFGILRNYTVFNVDQIDGGHLDHLRVTDTTDSFVDYEPAERAIKATRADIRCGGDHAFYRQLTPDGVGDFIVVPPKHWFSPPSEYYAVALHELMHWSEARLGWTGSYAEGELRAEIGACYAVSALGLPHSEDLTNHHAYIKNWLKHLESDPRFIFKVATSASRAADFVLSFSREPEPVSV